VLHALELLQQVRSQLVDARRLLFLLLQQCIAHPLAARQRAGKVRILSLQRQQLRVQQWPASKRILTMIFQP
jgi:hypothetical protein